MMHIKSNIDKFVQSNCRDFEDSEVETMTEKQFDELPLSDQISIFNRFPDQYNRLTGKCTENTTPQTEDTRTEEEKFADEFEQRWSEYMDAITAHNARKMPF